MAYLSWNLGMFARGAAHIYPSSHMSEWSKLDLPALHRTSRPGKRHIRPGQRRKVAEKLHRITGGTASSSVQIGYDMVAQNLAA